MYLFPEGLGRGDKQQKIGYTCHLTSSTGNFWLHSTLMRLLCFNFTQFSFRSLVSRNSESNWCTMLKHPVCSSGPFLSYMLMLLFFWGGGGEKNLRDFSQMYRISNRTLPYKAKGRLMYTGKGGGGGG